MRTLSVTNFSCIEEAELELPRLTLIIGPQASGKSVLCKLAFFLIDAAHQQQTSITKLHSFDKFCELLKQRFVEWFPIEAWGSKRFRIELRAGEYEISLTRKTSGGRPADDFRIKISEAFEAQYQALLEGVQKIQRRTTEEGEVQQRLSFDYELLETIDKSLAKLMGRDSVAYQAFVPAGRSFFTSIGKAIAVFEQARSLDPLILRFGRLYTAYKDRRRFYPTEKPAELAARKALEARLADLMGGVMEKDGDNEYLRTPDGRRVPLAAMSSGQQELLPLVAFFPWLSRAKADRMCYIEEPEAHLFPAAQSRLIETLVLAGAESGGGANLVMTTHSSYVVTKVNNLLKAGSIGRKLSDEKRKELEKTVPRNAWLSPRTVRAYALQDGSLRSILGADGLVDAEYLDEISSMLNLEFSKLLELEESIA